MYEEDVSSRIDDIGLCIFVHAQSALHEEEGPSSSLLRPSFQSSHLSCLPSGVIFNRNVIINSRVVSNMLWPCLLVSSRLRSFSAVRQIWMPKQPNISFLLLSLFAASCPAFRSLDFTFGNPLTTSEQVSSGASTSVNV